MTGASEARVTLLPCPFCGAGPARVVGNASFSGVELQEGARGRHYVQCGTCGASALGSFHQQAAVDNWNTRATAPLLEVIEAARGENAANFDSKGEYWRGYDQACLDIHTRLTAALAAQKGDNT
ncbi:MAG: Lar family restriction alleviation protein [Armatimonadia bacterium]